MNCWCDSGHCCSNRTMSSDSVQIYMADIDAYSLSIITAILNSSHINGIQPIG